MSLLSLLRDQGASRALTLTGDVVNDAVRALGVQGDGAAVGSRAGSGVWPAATNLYAADAASWGVYQCGATDDLTNSKFPNSTGWTVKVAKTNGMTGFAAYQDESVSGATLGRTFSHGGWFYIAPGNPLIGTEFWVVFSERGGATANESAHAAYTLVAGWQNLTNTYTLLRNDRTSVRAEFYDGDGVDGGAYWMSGPMLSETVVPQPFTPTSTTAGRIQMPVPRGFSATAGAVVMKARMGYPSTGESANYFEFGDDSNNRLVLYKDTGGGVIHLYRIGGGAGGAQAGSTSTWVTGDSVAALATWTPTSVKTALQGAALVTAAQSTIPTLAATTFDVGGATVSGGGKSQSAIVWAAFYGPSGQFLGDGDSAHVARLGNIIDPLSDLPRPDDLVAFWDGVNDRYVSFV